MEIKKENVINAYMVGDNSVKEMLRAMFPDIEFVTEKQPEKRPITERVKTFEDACRELGDNHPFVLQYNTLRDNGGNGIDVADIAANLKLRIVCAALNEGWEPKFTKTEWRWYPLLYLWTSEELAEKNADWKRDRHLISVDDYKTGYAGFAFERSYAPSSSDTYIDTRLCLKNAALANYCGKQFINLWADLNLIRR